MAEDLPQQVHLGMFPVKAFLLHVLHAGLIIEDGRQLVTQTRMKYKHCTYIRINMLYQKNSESVEVIFIMVYCEIILFRGVFNYVEFVGKTIHELKYQRTKIPSVRFSNAIITCKS